MNQNWDPIGALPTNGPKQGMGYREKIGSANDITLPLFCGWSTIIR